MNEKIVCPYCKVDLHFGDNEEDEVAYCNKCGLITCNLCAESHYREEHTGLIWNYGYLDEKGIFRAKDFTCCED